MYILTDPDDIYHLSNTCLQKDQFSYDFTKELLGLGLLYAPVPTWRRHRKLISPAFNQLILDGFMGIFNAQGKLLVERLKQVEGKGPFDHSHYVRQTFMETICLTAIDDKITEDVALNYVKAFESYLNYNILRFQTIWLYPNFIYRFSSLKKKQDASVKFLQDTCDMVLRKKRAQRKLNSLSNSNKDANPKVKVFMDLILDYDEGTLSDQEIRDEINTIMMAGHETSATVTNFFLLLLGSYPDVQERVYKELQEVLGDRDVEKSDLSQLVYLEAVIKETMRYYVMAPFVGRYIDREVKLKNCTLKPGHNCLMLIYGVHRNPLWGPDVEEFRPERWLNPETIPKNVNYFASFSIGKRNCIGKTYAMMSMKTLLCHLLRRYKIHADHSNIVLKLDVLLKPVSGHFITIEDRLKSKLWDKFVELTNECLDKGNASYFLIGTKKLYVLTDPDDISVVSNICLDKDKIFSAITKRLLGEGLVFAEVPKWKRHRKLLLPAFNQQILDSYLPIFNSQGRKLVKKFEKKCGKGPFDCTKYLKRTSLDTIFMTAMGLEISDQESKTFLTDLDTAIDKGLERFQKFWLMSDIIYKFSNVKKEEQSCMNSLRTISELVLSRKRKEIALRQKSNVNYQKDKNNYLEQLLYFSNDLTDDEIIDEIHTIIIAGNDTTATVIMYALILIGSYPNVQEKVMNELENVFGDSDRDVQKHDLVQMRYLEAFLKECMRYYVMVPFVSRYIDKEIKLKNYVLRPGNNCLFLLYGVHRNGMWGENADQFRPERWLENKVPSNSNAFMPFSVGKRNCIGRIYAMMFMKTQLSHILRSYTIHGDHMQLKLSLEMLLRPASGHYISIQKKCK
ncbi:cytochrome P450 4V2-like [Melitaea cinxia]|uniref:cytochrome P450 4V2-like n=1 Tax=Melitaea cinxia TaxID=113334 RepID=UPI001E270B41|nr:cytochrome P450 4V2-like [Melitaea cinxia]